MVNATQLWALSRVLHEHKYFRLARLVKGANYLLNKAILPPEAVVGTGLQLGHRGLGIVIHPNVIIGDDVFLWHRVTLAVSGPVGSAVKLTIGNGVTIGSGACVVTPFETSMIVAENTVIGANAVVTRDTPPGVVVAGVPARVLHDLGAGKADRFR